MKRKFDKVNQDHFNFHVVDSTVPITVCRTHPIIKQSHVLKDRDIDQYFIPCEKTTLSSLIQWIDMGTVLCNDETQKKMDIVIELLKLDPLLN